MNYWRWTAERFLRKRDDHFRDVEKRLEGVAAAQIVLVCRGTRSAAPAQSGSAPKSGSYIGYTKGRLFLLGGFEGEGGRDLLRLAGAQRVEEREVELVVTAEGKPWLFRARLVTRTAADDITQSLQQARLFRLGQVDDNDRWGCLLQHGDAYLDFERPAEARSRYLEVLESPIPNLRACATFGMAMTHRQQGEDDAAIRLFTEVLEIEAADAAANGIIGGRAHFFLGLTCVKIQAFSEGREHFVAAQAAGVAEAQNALDLLDSGS